MQTFLNKKENVLSLRLIRETESLTASLCLAKMAESELAELTDDWMHPQEKSTLARLTFPRRRASYILGRYCAKKALQRQINSVALNKMLIGEGIFHQPILYTDEINTRHQLSIAHTQDLGVALVFEEKHPMGVDIELNDHQHNVTIASQLTPLEKNFLENHWHPPFDIQPYSWIWTVKEALGKVLKTGLTVPLSLYEIKEIGYDGVFIICTYKNFLQYKALSFLWNQAIISIVLPRKTDMSFIDI